MMEKWKEAHKGLREKYRKTVYRKKETI